MFERIFDYTDPLCRLLMLKCDSGHVVGKETYGPCFQLCNMWVHLASLPEISTQKILPRTIIIDLYCYLVGKKAFWRLTDLRMLFCKSASSTSFMELICDTFCISVLCSIGWLKVDSFQKDTGWGCAWFVPLEPYWILSSVSLSMASSRWSQTNHGP